MKKSKIIIPALALIAFSVAASVTGAVAWFTASRSAQITAGSYSVVKTSAELSYKLTGGIGTSVDQTNHPDTVVFDGYLTDGSFSHKGATANDIFITYPSSDGKTMGGTVNLADAEATTTGILRGTNAADSKSIYTVATFNLSFTVSFGATGENVGLFLNNASGQTEFTVKNNDPAVTATGFRMAFVPKSDSANGQAKVLADLQTAANCKYIKSKTDNPLAGSAYDAVDLIDSSISTAMPEDKALTKANALLRNDYLGYFAFSSGAQVNLNFTVVAWFEGTDPNVVNQASASLYQQVTSKLVFEAVNLAD